MKHIVRKPYWNYENEEKWLNEMAAKGLVLTDYSWCRYVFEEEEKGKYIYRIELLEKRATHTESVAYIRFMEEHNIEFIASYMRWVYFRKKASDGEFNIYSDTDSKLKYYKRVVNFWNVLSIIEFSAGVINLGLVISLVAMGEFRYSVNNINLIGGILVVILGFMFLAIGAPLRRKIKKLKHDKLIQE